MLKGLKVALFSHLAARLWQPLRRDRPWSSGQVGLQAAREDRGRGGAGAARGRLAGGAVVGMAISDPGLQGGKQGVGPKDVWELELHSTEQRPTSGPWARTLGWTCQANSCRDRSGGWRRGGRGYSIEGAKKLPSHLWSPGEPRRDAGWVAGDRDGAWGPKRVGTRCYRSIRGRGRLGPSRPPLPSAPPGMWGGDGVRAGTGPF